MEDGIWLCCHYKAKIFDVEIEDIDRTNFIDLVDEIIEIGEKQDVYLPDIWKMNYKDPRTGVLIAVVNDGNLMSMFPLFKSKNTIDIWIWETEEPGEPFMLALDKRNKRIIEEEGRVEQLADDVEQKRQEALEEEEYGRMFEDQIPPNSIEVPVVNAEDLEVDYHKVCTIVEGGAEQFHFYDVFGSQPQPTQTQFETQPQQPQPLPSKPPKPTKRRLGKESTPVKKKFKPAKSTSKKRGTFVATSTHAQKREGLRSKVVVEQDEITHDKMSLEDNDSDDDDFTDVYSEIDSDLESLDDECFSEDDNDELPVTKEFEDFLDGDCELDKIYKNGIIVGDLHFGSIKLLKWMIFSSKDHFSSVFRDFCIQEGFCVRVIKADNNRYTAICAIEGGDWRIHSTVMMDGRSWAIKMLVGEHKTCGFLERNPMVNCEWLCSKLVEDIKANPEVPIETLKEICQQRFRVQVRPRLLYKVRMKTKELIHGGYAESYALLPAYAEVIKATNPGSYALVSWTKPQQGNISRFKACFFSFLPQVQGFLRGCRPIIGIDGCHLSGYYKGILLSTMAIDGNNEIFCIGYGIVEAESIMAWTYFFKNMRALFRQQGCEKEDWTFISDRMKGVDTSLDNVFPRATRRVCAQHLYSNFKSPWSGGEYHKYFWIAANAYNPYVFNKSMEKMSSMDPESVAYLNGVSGQWSKHMFETNVCCDHNTSNFVESFNAVTKPYRDLPILSLLEATRTWSMKRIGQRFDKACDLEDNQVTDYAASILESRSDESRLCYAVSCGGGEFEVKDGRVRFPIRLDRFVCACGVWQITGIPCKHALRVIYNERLEPKDFVSLYYKGTAYKATYSTHIHAMPDSSQWPSYELPKIKPPPLKRGLGRPAKVRKRGKDEPKKGKRNSTVKCSKCNNVGHNVRTCKGAPTAKQKKSAAASSSVGPSTSSTAETSKSGAKRKNKEKSKYEDVTQ